jgi:folate-binding protein YgfZ
MDESVEPGLLFEDTAVVDAGEREVIRATGADRVSFLHRLVTGDVAGVPVGGGTRALLLNLKGHIVSDMRVFVRPEEVRLVVSAGQAETTVTALSKYAIMDDFTAVAEPELERLALYGPRSVERLAAAGVAVGPLGEPWSHTDAGEFWAVKARALGADGIWLFGARGAIADLAEGLAALGVRRLAPGVVEALRVAAGEPAWGSEIKDDYFPMEIGLDGAIDYAKGCYLGQEPIVRIRDRGHINWRLVRLRLRGEGIPAPGDALESDPKPRAGRITSVGQLAGEPAMALALLHVSVPDGSEVRVKHGDAVLPAEVLRADAAGL